MLAWGLSWTNGKILAGYTAVSHLIFWRFFMASILFTPFVFLTHNWKIHSSRGWKGALLGGVLIGAYNLFFFLGSQLGLAGAGGVLVTTLNPILTAVIAALWFRRSLRKKDYVGLGLGIIGGSIILRIWDFSFAALFHTGNAFFLLCALVWAFLTVLTESVKDSINILTFSLIAYWVAGLLALPFSLVQGIGAVFHLDWIFWINLFSASVGAMAFGTTVYFLATKSLGSERSSAFIFMVPVSAMGFAKLFLHEPLILSTLIGGALAIVAVYLINRR